MSSSSSQTNAPAAKIEEKNPARRRMTEEQIERLIRYKTVHMPVEEWTRLCLESKELKSKEAPKELKSKEVPTPAADRAYKVKLPVPMDQIDDYVANILREINESEARFMRERERILNDYHTKGYAEEPEEPSLPAVPAPAPAPAPNRNPPPGRRRFRPGVIKSKQAGKPNKMV